MNDDLSIFLGDGYEVGGFKVKNPKIEDIIEYGEDNYISAINIFTLKPSDMMVQLYDDGIDYQEIDKYTLFCMMCSEILVSKESNKKSKIQERIGWLTGIFDFEIYLDENRDIFLYSESTGCKIDKGVYYLIRSFLLKINCKDDSEKYNPGNESTKKSIIQQERRRMEREKKKKNRGSVFVNYISSLVWGNTSGYKYEDVLKLNIWQFYDAIKRINKIKLFDYNMIGFYTGSIKYDDIKKIEEKISWDGKII